MDGATEFVRKNPTALGLVVAVIGFGMQSYAMQTEMQQRDSDHERRIQVLEVRTIDKLSSIERDISYMRGRLDDVLETRRMDDMELRQRARQSINKTDR
jgi:hypothetical protein